MREVIGRSTRRLAIIGIPLALLLALVVVLGVWADDDASAAVSGGNLVQYQIMAVDAEGDRWEILLPDGFEYVGLAAGSEVMLEPEVTRRGQLVVWEGPLPDAGVLRFWVAPDVPGVAPQSLPVEGAGDEAVRAEPVARLFAHDDVQPAPDVDAVVPDEAEPTADLGDEATSEVEATPDVGDEATAEAEPTPDLGAEATAEAEPTPDVGDEATPEAEPTPNLGDEATPEAEPTPDLGDEATPEAEPTPDVNAEATAEAEPTPDAGAEPTAEAAPAPDPDAAVEAEILAVSVAKSVVPNALETGDSRWVTYIVTFTNSTGGIATLDSITDTLPSGFLFGGMAVMSEVGEPDDNIEPDIVWEGVTVPGQGTRTLRYYAKAVNRAGDYENSVVGNDGGTLIGPESATLHVEAGVVFLPTIIRYYPEFVGVQLPYEENFSVAPAAYWVPFTNWRYWDEDLLQWVVLDAGRWWTQLNAYNYKSDRVLPENKEWDLSMFNAPGAELWTNYRIEARMKDSKDHAIRRGMTGIWFRGTYENSGAMDGESVGGYYLFMRPWSDNPDYQNRLFLMRIPKDDMSFDAATIVDRYHYEDGIGRQKWYDVRIDVQGSRIRVSFGRPEDGGMIENVIDWTDTFPAGAWTSGTVGFATYFTESHYDYIRVSPLPPP